MNKKDIEKLINWYKEEKRDLPWRHTSDSYKIWISEVMLQQTRVEAVKEYYKRFLRVLPDIESLANVEEDILLKLWEGLGYYSRAKNLKKCAKEVINLGLKELPKDKETLKNLPGIGPYTTGAILSIAYRKPTPAIDGNVIRILSRIFEDERDLLKTSVKEEYENLLNKFMTKENARDFTEGFIELGALVCLPNGNPICEKCPFQSICKSYKHHTMLNYPVKKEKTKRKIMSKTVYVLEYKGKYVVNKRVNDGLLKGLYELPNLDKVFTKEELKSYLKEKKYNIENIYDLGNFKHIFSHVEWHMTAYFVKLKTKPRNISMYSKEEIETTYPLPTAFLKIFNKLK